MATSNPVSQLDSLLKDFVIPRYIFEEEMPVEYYPHLPSCPTIVFISTKSGGHLGSTLLTTFCSLLNQYQVFDLSKDTPDQVLRTLYGNLEKLKSCGDNLAAEIMNHLRLIVAGGDGTVSWLLSVVADLKLSKPPRVATLPLGTGNNIHYSFGWGKKNPGTDRETVMYYLEAVKNAREMLIDSWHIVMRMKDQQSSICDQIAPLVVPRSLHEFRPVLKADSLDADWCIFRGGFWNYFSMGMDAQVSYEFHHERTSHPEKFTSQLTNQKTYAKLVCAQGWFCTSFRHPNSQNIARLVKVKILKHGKWVDLEIPRCIRSIVCLNLPSFSGGLNPWGTPSKRKQRQKDLTAPFVDDGLLEIVGFKDAWHGLVLLSPKGHGTRLAQAHGVRFRFHSEVADHAYMRIDGEPWRQPLPQDNGKVIVEITHHGQVKVLATKSCIAKSMNESPSPHGGQSSDDDSDDDRSEEKSHFGAATSFKHTENLNQ